MTTFSALNLPVTATGQKEVLAGLEQIDKKVGVIQVSASKMAEALKKTNGDLQAAARMVAAEEEKAAAAVDKVTAAAQRAAGATTASFTATATSAELMEVRSARATQGIARGLEMVARTGKLTGRSLDAVMSNVSGLALGFGTGGVLIGAIGIATASIVELFMRTRKELEKTQTEFNNRLDEMAKAGNIESLAGRFGTATQLMSGDPFADIIGKNPGESDLKFIARSKGLAGVQAEYDRLRAKMNSNPSMFRQGSSDADKMREAAQLMLTMGQQWEKVQKITDSVTKTTVEEVAAGIRVARDAKDQKDLFGNFAPNAYMPGNLQGMGLKNLLPGLINDAGRTFEQQLLDQRDVFVVERETAKTTEQRLEAIRQIAEISKQIYDLHPELHRIEGERGDGVVKISKFDPITTRGEAAARATAERYRQLAGQAADSITSTMVNAVSRGFEAAFSKGGSVKSVFKALTGAVLEGLGTMFIQIGEASLAGLAVMAKIKAAIIAFAPEFGIAAAIGLIAVGAALKGTGAAIASSGVGGGGGGSSYSTQSYAPITNYGSVNPAAGSSTNASSIAARPTIIFAPTVLGVNDPTALRGLDEMLTNLDRRGRLG